MYGSLAVSPSPLETWPRRPSQTKPSTSWWMPKRSGIAPTISSRRSRTRRSVAMPSPATATPAVKSASGETHIGRLTLRDAVRPAPLYRVHSELTLLGMGRRTDIPRARPARRDVRLPLVRGHADRSASRAWNAPSGRPLTPDRGRDLRRAKAPRGAGVAVLVAKAKILGNHKRSAEAIVG